MNVVFSVGFFIFMYKFLPLVAATELKRVNPVFGEQIVFNLVDGIIRLLLFLLFIWGTSLWKDIRRVYEYHGAEHKTVFAFENGDPLNTAAVQKYSTYHPRCGTSFLMTVMIISILVYMLVPVTTFWARFAVRIVLLPVITGLVLRNHSFCRQTSRIAVCPDDGARFVDAAHHNQASVGRAGGVRHRRTGSGHVSGKAARRRTSHCLAGPVVGRSSLAVGRQVVSCVLGS